MLKTYISTSILVNLLNNMFPDIFFGSIFSPRHSKKCRPPGIQDALVDLLLLSQGVEVLGSFKSSFSAMASHFRMVPFPGKTHGKTEILVSEKSTNSQPNWWKMEMLVSC